MSSQQLGPADASLQIKTYREGRAAKVGHDLIIEVGEWQATVELADGSSPSSARFTADSRSLKILEGLRGLKPLSDRDQGEIVKTIDSKVLRGAPISFTSTDVTRDGDALTATGELEIAGGRHHITVTLQGAAEGRYSGTVVVKQSAWGIKPYSGLMGALKVRDEVEVELSPR